jgi:hypothetical protein
MNNSHDIQPLPYPGGKRFAFTIVDDTDAATLANIRPIYDYLDDLGLRTTKTVWTLEPEPQFEGPASAGATALDKPYRDYMLELQKRGFEMALHNASGAHNTRQRTMQGIEDFKSIFGAYPPMNIHHEKNRENLYFNSAAQDSGDCSAFSSPVLRGAVKFLRQSRRPAAGQQARPAAAPACSGENPESEYFWGDICREKIRYVRTNVFFTSLDTLCCNPDIPYRRADTPYVNNWFDSSNGQDVTVFNRILTPAAMNWVVKRNSCTILYTHFGKGFTTGSGSQYQLNPVTKERLAMVSGLADGWFATTGVVLDRLRAFQQISFQPFAGGLVASNQGDEDVDRITFIGEPKRVYRSSNGCQVEAGATGVFVLPKLAKGEVCFIGEQGSADEIKTWTGFAKPMLAADLHIAVQKVLHRFGA